MLAEKFFTEKLSSFTAEDPLWPLCPLSAVCATWVSMHTAPLHHTESYHKEHFALLISAVIIYMNKLVSRVRY